MEGLRGVAVSMVFLTHFLTLAEPWYATDSAAWIIATYVRYVGNFGVDLFFVLSGYLIYRMLIVKQIPFFKYLMRRIRRIYPVFLTVFCIYVCAAFLLGSERLPAQWSLRALYLVENLLLLPGIFSIQPLITVAWSLSYEFFYYLAVPLLISILNLRRWPSRKRLWLLGALSCGLCALLALDSERIRLVMFLAGMLVFELEEQNISSSRPYGLFAFLFAVIGVVSLREVGAPGWCRIWLLFFCFGALCWDGFESSNLTGRILRWEPLRALGNMSYSYYLMHGFTLKAGFTLLPRFWTPANDAPIWSLSLLILFMFAITLATSFALYALVEVPFSLQPSRSLPTKPLLSRAEGSAAAMG